MLSRTLTISAALASAMVLATPAATQPLETVKVAASFVGLWDTSQPTFCKARGEFEKAGLDVQITSTRGGSETVQAVTAGGMDIAYSPGAYAVLAAYMQGAPIKIISAQFKGANDIFMYVKPDSPIQSIEDMAGKKVGFPRPGGSTHIMLLALQAERDLDFELIATGAEDATRTMVMTDQVDVGYYLPPNGVDAVANGEVRMLFSGDIVESMKNIPGRVNMASASFVEERRPVAEKFMQVLNECIDWMYANPDEAVHMFADLNDISDEVARDTIKFYSRDALAFAPLDGFDEVIKRAIENDFIDTAPTEEQLDDLIEILYTPKQ